MESFWGYYDTIKVYLAQAFEVGKGDFYGGIFAWVVTGISGFIVWRVFRGSLAGFFFLQRRVVVIPRALRAYQQKLTEATLTIRHSWKLDGQDFSQLLVPVHFESLSSGTRQSIDIFLSTEFSSGKCPRFILVGEPGSGKSVAMGSLARKVWQVARQSVLVPVLLTFSEIKHVKSEEDLENAVINSLQKYFFEKGKRTKRACHFAQTRLYKGEFLLLLDGFDELEKNTRHQIIQFLEVFFSKYPQIPFVLSCRTAVWNDSPGLLATIGTKVVSMVRFNNNDIRQFLSAWDFQGNKSSEQLGELIRSKPYLQTIAENPLMLTIIAFLYAQPKRILPDNRVKFYQECVDALMEKFDHAKQIERANEFETVDKVTILSHVAYRHIIDSETTDTEILRETVLDTIKSVMERLSRPSEKRQKMLDEIVQNTELLVNLPPDHYKFPHRTFMEYFAANYFQEEGKIDELLQLYSVDKGKWQETLALFCGINLNEEISKKSLDALEGHFDRTGSDTLVFRALVESAKIRPEWAAPLLVKAKGYLSTNFSYELVEYLGYIGANPNLTYASDATAILTQMLSHKLSNEEVTALLIALSANRSGNADELIKKYFENITLDGFYEFLKHDTRSIVSIIQYFNYAKLEGFIKVATENSDIPVLLSILKNTSDSNVKFECALAVANVSQKNSRLFYDSLNDSGEFHVSRAEAEVVALFENWNWEYHRPMSTNGKRTIALVAYYLVWGVKNKGNFERRYKKDDNNKLLRYYTMALASKRRSMVFPEWHFQLWYPPFPVMRFFWNRKKPVINMDNSFLLFVKLAIFMNFVFIFNLNWYFVAWILSFAISFFLERRERSGTTAPDFLWVFILSVLSGFIFLYAVLGKYLQNTNRYILFFIGCVFCVLNLIYVNSISLPYWMSTAYNLYYGLLFVFFNIIETGLLGFIIPPFSVLGLIWNNDEE